MRNKGWMFLPVLLLFWVSSGVFAFDYFMFDEEQSKIMHMSNSDYDFNKMADLEKRPDVIMRQIIPIYF